MAPQESVPLVATILGLLGTVLWCLQLVPQIWHSYRTKSTEGLPFAMMLLWSWSGLPFGVYAITQQFNIPLQIQPQCFAILCMANFGQCLVYSYKWRWWSSWLVCSFMIVVMGGSEVMLVLVIRGPYERGVSWPVITMGIVACVTLLSGYVPIPFELVKRRGRVIGISFVFLVLDSFGALFSLMSLGGYHIINPRYL